MNDNDKIYELQVEIEKIKTDFHNLLQSTNKLVPGVACKILYDANGHVLKGEKLSSDDLPDIPIGKITGLNEEIQAIKKHLKERSAKAEDSTPVEEPIISTGTKINYDQHGRVLSSTKLTIKDIPILDINHVKGLSERIEFLESAISKADIDALNERLDQLTSTVNSLSEYKNYKEMVNRLNATVSTLSESMERVEKQLNVIREQIKSHK